MGSCKGDTMMRLSAKIFTFGLVAVVALDAAAKEREITLAQLMSVPFPENLVAAPHQGLVAWTFNDRGARNIWVAAAPDYKARAVTAYTGDEGQALSNLLFTQEDHALVYVRGGAGNAEKEIPNPASSPAGAEQAIWMVPLAGGEPKRIAEGNMPEVSPSRKGIAFIKGGQIWFASLLGDDPPRQLIHARGVAKTLRWSPDGGKLAFVSQRERHGFIGIYDFAANSLLWLDPSVNSDQSPTWSPDGKALAFISFPAKSAEDELLFVPKRSGTPWSICVADVMKGTSREVWRAKPTMGSLLFTGGKDPILFWGDGHLVFSWERDGWRHLYTMNPQGGEAELLTPGEFEVDNVVITPDGKALLFNSNQGDSERRHLWRVPVAGGKPVLLTPGTGIEWSPVPAGDGKTMVFLRSDARHPAHPALLASDGPPRDLAPETMPADFPAGALVAPEPVTFQAVDGMTIHGQLFRPASRHPGERHPAVVYFHGGSRNQMLLGWHYGLYYHNAYALNQYLVSRGYVVLSVNFRSGTGYGMEFREALNYGASGASEFNDVLGAGRYMQSRIDVDGKRIGVWGGSYGGFLTALGLARASDLFAAGAEIHGIYDWNQVIHFQVPGYDPLRYPELARVAMEASPMASVKSWRSPVLLIHGDDDRNVPFTETVDLAIALRKQDVPFEELIFPDEVHSFLLYRNWLRAYEATADFFDRRMAKH